MPIVDIEYLLNQSEVRHGVKTHIPHSPSGYRINVDQHCRTPSCSRICLLFGLNQFFQVPKKAAIFDQGLRVDSATPALLFVIRMLPLEKPEAVPLNH